MSNHDDFEYIEDWDRNDPETECAAYDAAEEMQCAVDSLGDDLLDIYTLWSTGEYSLEELATEFKLTIGTIRARIKRITAHIRRNVSQETLNIVGLAEPSLNRFGTDAEFRHRKRGGL